MFAAGGVDIVAPQIVAVVVESAGVTGKLGVATEIEAVEAEGKKICCVGLPREVEIGATVVISVFLGDAVGDVALWRRRVEVFGLGHTERPGFVPAAVGILHVE